MNFQKSCLGLLGSQNIEKIMRHMSQGIHSYSELAQPYAKFLWKTYGAHHIILVMICNKGKEGQTIFDLRETLEKKRIRNFDVFIGFSWEEVDFTAY